jgi:hypothetical protein
VIDIGYEFLDAAIPVAETIGNDLALPIDQK